METTVSFPYQGRLYKARNKKFEETVLFIPFFGARQRELSRHVKFVTDLGYDAVVFDLQQPPALLDFSQGLLTPLKKWRELKSTLKLPLSWNKKLGLKHVYADQIETMMNLIPGKKIVFAFSNPGGAAIEAMARRHCHDISGAIFDSGPSGKFIESFANLAKHQWKIPTAVVRLSMAPLLSFGWSPYLHQDIHTDLRTFPKGYKILSIRGWKDLLVPPNHIDAIFEPHLNLNWRKLNLPEAGHLLGLRDFRTEYAPPVESFLLEISSPLK